VKRFLPLDGLRGIAAVSVALYHFQQRIPFLDSRLPRWVSVALQHGNLGVQVFFVLSGFAVARSLSATTIDAPNLGRFMLRRAIRLDPPYALTVLVVTLLALHNPAGWPVPPTPGLVVAHLFYLQGILGMFHLQGVFWTLCIEIQLYLAFALLLGAAQRVSPNRGFDAVLVGSAWAAAALTWMEPRTSVHLLPFWPLFCAGVLVERADRMARSKRWLFALVIGLAAANVVAPRLEAMAGIATACVLFAATRGGALFRSLSTRPLLAMGRGSYSFYLLHALVGGAVFDAITPRASAMFDSFRFALALAASAAAAFALHRLVEVPTHRWSRQLEIPRRVALEATSERLESDHELAAPAHVAAKADLTGGSDEEAVA